MRSRLSAVMVLCLLVHQMAFAQGANPQLGGVVTDQSGALIPGATITVQNTNTGVTNTAITNESGAYNFPSLQPGQAYRVSASLPGFQTKVVNNLPLPASTNNRQDFQLIVAAGATTTPETAMSWPSTARE